MSGDRGRRHLSRAQARRLALAAQGFTDPRPVGAVTLRHVDRVLARVALLQIDSINVLARSHYLPLFARLGGYDRGLLDAACASAPRHLVEYWAHEASYVEPGTHRLLRWRMARHATEAWGGMRGIARDDPGLVEAVFAQVVAAGPVTARQVEAALTGGRVGDPGRGPWWEWSTVKKACELLFWAGRVTSAGRTASFERRYDLPARVLPALLAAADDPDPDEARRELVRRSARALGVATPAHLRDYFRLTPGEVASAVGDLLDAGELAEVSVQGWPGPAYLVPGTPVPRSAAARALLSPFDSLVFHRPRTEALFGVRHRLEVYLPAARRVHGYYVLLFLVGEHLRARVDLKADRAASRLAVRAVWSVPPPEDAVAPGPARARRRAGTVASTAEVVQELAEELAAMARWLGLGGVHVHPEGDLAVPLARAVAAGTG